MRQQCDTGLVGPQIFVEDQFRLKYQIPRPHIAVDAPGVIVTLIEHCIQSDFFQVGESIKASNLMIF